MIKRLYILLETKNRGQVDYLFSKIVIQDHSAGHVKGGHGPHFNVRPADDTRNGQVPGTKPHYYFEK